MTYVPRPLPDGSRPVAAVTGASSGFGEAIARELAASGFDVAIGARRMDRLEKLAAEIGARAFPLDVTDVPSVEAFARELPVLHVLVNNAGGAIGLEPVAESVDDHWRTMWETNVFGLMAMTRACLPALERGGDGHIVNIGSIAGLEVYPGGAGYTSAKHAVRAITDTLRIELVGKPIRITEIDPGMAETEFSLIRFAGDRARADSVYQGVDPLVAGDIADIVAWAVTRPAHVNVDRLRVTPLRQATATLVARREH